MACFYLIYVGLLGFLRRSPERFKITGQTFEHLKLEGIVPDHILDKLEEIKQSLERPKLEDGPVKVKEPFLTTLEKTLGYEETAKYKSSILKYSDQYILHVPRNDDRKRAFRLRLFEPINRKDVQDTRPIIPWLDAAALSFRSFTKIGLGALYPNTMGLKVLTNIEWIIGAYMLIHFSIAVKNNLSFIVPFLGMVN